MREKMTRKVNGCLRQTLTLQDNKIFILAFMLTSNHSQIDCKGGRIENQFVLEQLLCFRERSLMKLSLIKTLCENRFSVII